MAAWLCGEQVELASYLPCHEAGDGILRRGSPGGHEGSHCATVEVTGAEATIAYLCWDDLAATPLAPTDNEGER